MLTLEEFRALVDPALDELPDAGQRTAEHWWSLLRGLVEAEAADAGIDADLGADPRPAWYDEENDQ